MRLRRAVLGLFALLGCTPSDARLLELAPCPCLEGWVCCERTGRCVRDETSDCSETPLALVSVDPAEGPAAGGTPVIVEGEGFTASLALSFGGRACLDVTVESARKATCTTPEGPQDHGVVDVVAEDGGRVAVLPRGFRYMLDPFLDWSLKSGIGQGFGNGLAIFDADGDGLPDVFQSRSESLVPADRAVLHENRGGLRFTDESADPVIASLPPQFSATPGDFTGDGRIDVLVGHFAYPQGTGPVASLVVGGSSAPSRLFTTAIAPHPTLQSTLGFHALDIDGDGDLDAAGCRGFFLSAEPTSDVAIVVAENDGGDLHVAPERVVAEPDVLEAGDSCMVELGDYDGDGVTDLLRCGLRMRLYRGEQGRLVERTSEAGLDGRLPDPCNSVSWVDFDADGDLDIAWVATNRSWDYPPGIHLLENDGGSFARVPDAPLDDARPLCPESMFGDAQLSAGLNGVVWLDADHDGDEDIFVVTPFLRCTTPPLLYENQAAQGQLRFHARALSGQGSLYSNGLAATDLDADGDLDVVWHAWGPPGALWRNNLMENSGTSAGPRGRYLRVRALTDADGDATDGDTSDDVDAWGVRVELDLDGPADMPDFSPGHGKLQVRITGQTGPSARGVASVHFGLGERAAPLWVRVRFPDGTVAVIRAVELDTTLLVRDFCDGMSCP